MQAPVTIVESTRDSQAEADVIACLIGESRRPRTPASFADLATQHGVAPLVVKRGIARWLPPREASRLLDTARREAVLTALRDRHLGEALDALHAAGVDTLVMKGAHLAHACYPEPHLRPSADSDVLIRPEDRDRTVTALAAEGYRLEAGATNRHALGQMLLQKRDCAAAVLDVHWRVSVPFTAAAFFDFGQLLERAVPIPQLGKHARGLDMTDALALACVHQAAHHPDLRRLLWAYDIYLLLESLDERHAAAFVRMAVDRRMARICLAMIEEAMHSFPSRRGPSVVEALRHGATREPASPLMRHRRKIDDLRLDLAALGWSARARLIVAHLLPPADFMRTTYAPGSQAPLAWLYARRAARGVRKWFT